MNWRPLTSLLLAVSALTRPLYGVAAEPDYEKIYPQYVEYCGLSQITKVSTYGIKEVGGQGGHAVFLIRGACHDHSYPYARLKICEESDPLPHEVGTSVNSDFQTYNWVATDSKDFLFYGGIKPGQDFDVAAYNQVQLKAQEMDVLNGMHYHTELYAKNETPGMNDVTYMYQDSIGTDYGANLGRNMTCDRLPVSRQQLQEIVDYYNSRNDYYYLNHINFEWSFLNNNCAHLPHNALAEAGFWAPVEIGQPLPQALDAIEIPQNLFVNMMRRTNDMPLEEPDELFRDEYARKALLERGWLPTQPGSLAEYIPVHQPNQIFATNLSDLLFQIPLVDPAGSDRTRFITDARYTDIKSNLEYYLSRYQAIQKNRQPLEHYTTPHGRTDALVTDPAFPAFYAKYYDYIAQQIQSVTEKLSQL
jgi:hypothetical protein